MMKTIEPLTLKYLALSLLCSALALSAGAAAPRPNIVFIMVDDMGYSDIGCYGGEIETPHVDSLAESGLRFTNFRVTPMCVVSRASILSGMEYQAAGKGFLPNGLSFAYLLRDAGYHTSIVGKVHAFGDMMQGDPETDYGFDRYYGHKSGATDCFNGKNDWWLDDQLLTSLPPDFYATDAITDYTIDFIDEARSQGKPFMTWVCYNAPHSPLQAPEANVMKYRNAGTYDAGWDQLREKRFERQKAMGIVGEDWVLPRKGVEIPDWNTLPETSSDAWVVQKDFEAFTMCAYAGMVDRVDENVGRLLDHLRDPNGDGEESDSVLDETLIIFCSDNGGAYSGLYVNRDAVPWDRNPGGSDTFTCNYGWGMLKNTPYRYYKHSSHGGGIQSSLVVHWPDGISVADGSILRQNCNLWDFYPTFLELAGATYPASYTIPGTSVTKTPNPLMGESIVPIFTDAASAAGSDLFISSYLRSRGVVDNEWKIVSYVDSPWELYNLEDDPTERFDLAGVNPSKLSSLIQQWDDHMDSTGIPSSWNPTPGSKHRGWGYDRIRSGLSSSIPEYMSAGVPLDTKLTLNFDASIDFADTAGETIRLQKYGDPAILWQADPDEFHPAQGTKSITFDDFPTLEPDTHYFITWDSGWEVGMSVVREATFAYRFKTAATYASGIKDSSSVPDVLGYMIVDGLEADRYFDFIFDESTTPATPIVQFRGRRNPLDATMTIGYSTNLLDGFSSLLEIDGETHAVIDESVVESVHERNYDDTTDFSIRIDPAIVDDTRGFFRASATWKTNVSDNAVIAMWTFRDGYAPDQYSSAAVAQDATLAGANSGIISNAGGYSFNDPIIAWSGNELPESALTTELQTAIVAVHTMQVTRVQYTGYLWSKRATTNATDVSADVVAWLNGAVDDPEIVSIHKNLVSGSGGTNMTRFSVIYEISQKNLYPGDEWDLRLRLTDGNSNADVLSAEGFGIDTVVLYGDEPVVYVPPSDTKVIASYSFNTGSGASSDTETLTTAGAYSMAYYNSASPGTAGFTDVVNGLGLPSGAAASSIDRDSNPTLSDALNTTDFTAQTHLHQFTVTIPANATVSIDRIQFDWGVAETKHFNSLSPAFELVSDKTGSTILASDNFSIPASVSSNIYSPDGAGVLKTYDIDLSGNTSLQNLSNTTVTFIIALDENANKDAAERRHVIDNVVLKCR